MRIFHRFISINENSIIFKMEDMICNANAYSAFLEERATKEEMCEILKEMMNDSHLIMTLNLAASVNTSSHKNKR